MDQRYVRIGRRGDGPMVIRGGQPQTKRRAAVSLSAGLVLKAIRVVAGAPPPSAGPALLPAPR